MLLGSDSKGYFKKVRNNLNSERRIKLIIRIIVGIILCLFFSFWFCLFFFGGIVGGTIGVINRLSLNKFRPEYKTKREELFEVAKIVESENITVPMV